MTYRSQLQLKSANAMAQRFAHDAMLDRREDAASFLAAIETAIEKGIAAGINRDYLHDTATGALDAISDVEGQLLKALDAENLSHALLVPLDTSELKSIIIKLRETK